MAAVAHSPWAWGLTVLLMGSGLIRTILAGTRGPERASWLMLIGG